jgi:ATP-binding cassette subfamily F protein uup
VEDFPGNYSDYRTYEDSQILERRDQKKLAENTKNTWKESTSETKLSYLEQKEYKQLEKDIQKLEANKEELEKQFTNPDLSGEEIDALSITLKEVVDHIDEKTERWFQLSAMLEG